MRQWIQGIILKFKKPQPLTYEQQWKNNYFTKEVI